MKYKIISKALITYTNQVSMLTTNQRLIKFTYYHHELQITFLWLSTTANR
jgi:hypothetical protein